MSLVETRYEVLKDVGELLNFKFTIDPNINDWDLYWTDMAV